MNCPICGLPTRAGFRTCGRSRCNKSIAALARQEAGISDDAGPPKMRRDGRGEKRAAFDLDHDDYSEEGRP